MTKRDSKGKLVFLAKNPAKAQRAVWQLPGSAVNNHDQGLTELHKSFDTHGKVGLFDKVCLLNQNKVVIHRGYVDHSSNTGA